MRFKKASPTNVEIDLTPMIDVTFQLITFFMVITNFENTQADERVKLPSDQLARPADSAPEHELVLNMGFLRNSSGQEISDPVIFYGDGHNYKVSEMGAVLAREQQYYEDIGINLKDVTVVLRADAKFPTGLVQEILKTSQETGFSKFKLRASQQNE